MIARARKRLRPRNKSNLLLSAAASNQVSSDTVCLQTETINKDGTTSAIIQAIPGDRIVQAQQIISQAIVKFKDEQKTAICNAIKQLYPYSDGPQNGQWNALHHLIYCQKNLILIVKTSFGKSMILQAVSVLLSK